MNLEIYAKIKNQLSFTKRIGPNLTVFILDMLLFWLAVSLLQQGFWLSYGLAQLVFVVVFFHAFGLLHEASHSNLSDSTKVNQLLGYVTSIFCFLPFDSWKIGHLQHHRWSGNIDKDPVMRLVKTFNPNNKWQVRIYNVFWQSRLPFLAILQHIVFWSNSIFQLLDPKISLRLKIRAAISCVLPLAVYTAAFNLAPTIFNLKNFLPAIIVYLAVTEAINFPHHLGTDRLEKGFTSPVNQYRFTRSCYYPKWIAFFGLMNFNFHIEHHLFPSLPWFELGNARPLVKAALKEDYRESYQNEWILTNRSKDMRDVLLPIKEEVVADPAIRKVS